ncbi:MAG: DUF2723 domain-containing protein [Bacteroidales bacterium]
MSDISLTKSDKIMPGFQKVNNIAGWVVFAIALVTYLLTIEPTSSLWDCGEFIASANKLEVGHPPGAPLFMIAAKVFSLLSFGDNTKVAMMINALSALASAFTILFLFWSITYFARKLVKKNEADYQSGDLIAIIGSGVVGALAYTFSDTFWFSAVEGEVYALSSLFTAVVFWAILKWERIADEKYSNRWLVFIAYLMGLSIGVHLLNLLAIPAIVFVYYFRKYPVTKLGIFYAMLTAIAILGIVMYGIIPGAVKIASWFELMFVNGFGLPYNTGVIFYILLLVGLVFFGIQYSEKHRKALLNTIILSTTVILIGYSSFSMTVIRAIADTPMNENKPDNVFSLLAYLNREQYGDRPLLYGQYFNADAIDEKVNYTYAKKNGKYEQIPTTNSEYKYDPEFSTLFPRMYSHQGNHITGYSSWANLSNTKDKPSFIENLAFFFGYQVNHMYIRYFMWNFSGRQNDEQGHGDHLKGNWITGIKFLDALRLGPQDKLPESMRTNKARNKYYMLPLILGLIGMVYMYQVSPRQFVVVMLLFILTGFAIVVYLNQTPYQPRERDYAYAGSFYAFAIWIGIGVFALADWLKKFVSFKMAAILATGITLLVVPGIMAKENWDDHDRSGRYTARDLAKNYLNSCAPNAILFTYGDNDTFPLWYVQEVEGFRTDVRVVNLSLLGTDWYINQMRKKAYESDPVPFTMAPEKYEQGSRDVLPVLDRYKEVLSLKEVIEFIASDDPRAKIEAQDGTKMNYIPGQYVAFMVDSAKVVSTGQVPKEMMDSLVPAVAFNLDRKYITKSDMMVLDLVANYKWDRPIYFASSVGTENYLNLYEHFQLEGFAYRLVPFRTTYANGDIGYAKTDILYDNVMNKFVWGRMNEPDVLIETYNLRQLSIMKVREVFVRLADALMNEKKKDSSIKVLDRMVELTPHSQVPYDYTIIPAAELYYRLGQKEKGDKIIQKLSDIYTEEVEYYQSLTGDYAKSVAYDTKVAMSVLQELVNLSKVYSPEINKTLSQKFNVYLEKYMGPKPSNIK